MKVAIYARYSSDKQSPNSIRDQIHVCKDRIEREGWTLVNTYEDAAISGALRQRPGYQQLLRDAQEGKFDIILCEALDRMSRDLEETARLHKVLTFAGVKLITLADNEIGELDIGLRGTISAIYLTDLANKTRRGLIGRVAEGRSGGGNSYGYKVVHKPLPNGEKEVGFREIIPLEAEVIERIFEEYASGISPRQIAKALNGEQIPGPRGRSWGPSTINGNAKRGTGILNNELYIGRLVFNRLRYMKDPVTQKRRSRLNPREEWKITEVPDLRIVPQDLWDRVKARQQAVSHKSSSTGGEPAKFWQKTRPKFLLSGRMKCGVCGYSYTKANADRFGCTGHRDRGICDNNLTIRGDDLEAAILDGLKSRLMEPQLFEQFVKDFTEETRRLHSQKLKARNSLEKQLAQNKRKIDRLVEAIMDGADALPINGKLKEVERECKQLEAKLRDSRNEEPLFHPNLAQLYRRHVENLGKALESPETGREAFEEIRNLIEAVILTPVKGELQIDLHGQLAHILSLSENVAKSTRSPKDRALQIKMVAGVGFEPTTFRL